MAQEIEKQRLGSRGRGNPNWVKGVSGNKNGRPLKTVCITSWLKEYADKKISAPVDAENLTFAQAAALSAWKAAGKGFLPEYSFIIDRIEGRVTDKVDVTSGGQPIKAEITVVSEKAKKLTEEIQDGKGTE